MASNDINKTMDLIVNHIIETKCSIVEAAKSAKENGTEVDIPTIHNWIYNHLANIDSEKYKKVVATLLEVAPPSVQITERTIKIYKAAELALQDYSLKDIAEILETSEETIKEDLTTNLKNLNPELAKEVKQHKNVFGTKKVKVSDFNKQLIEELILLSLTYRISYKSMAQLLKTTEEDVKENFEKVDKFYIPLYYLVVETCNEDEINERYAYIKGHNYLTERKKIVKEINDAKAAKDQNALESAQEKFRKLMTLIDDSIVSSLTDKKPSTFTEQEKEAVSRYRLKYAMAKKECARRIGHSAKTILSLDQELSEKNVIFKEKIERLDDFWREKQKEIATEYLNKQKR